MSPAFSSETFVVPSSPRRSWLWDYPRPEVVDQICATVTSVGRHVEPRYAARTYSALCSASLYHEDQPLHLPSALMMTCDLTVRQMPPTGRALIYGCSFHVQKVLTVSFLMWRGRPGRRASGRGTESNYPKKSHKVPSLHYAVP